MKVKCIDTKKPGNNSIIRSLTVGQEYTVLAIEFYDKSNSSFSNALGDFAVYRIKGDDGVVLPLPTKLFEVTLDRLPSCWVFYHKKDGSCSVLPKSWAREHFWDDYYNDQQSAIEEYKKAEQEIISEHTTELM